MYKIQNMLVYTRKQNILYVRTCTYVRFDENEILSKSFATWLSVHIANFLKCE